MKSKFRRSRPQRGAAVLTQLLVLVGGFGLVAGATMLTIQTQTVETVQNGDESMHASSLGTRKGLEGEEGGAPNKSQSDFVLTPAAPNPNGSPELGDSPNPNSGNPPPSVEPQDPISPQGPIAPAEPAAPNPAEPAAPNPAPDGLDFDLSLGDGSGEPEGDPPSIEVEEEPGFFSSLIADAKEAIDNKLNEISDRLSTLVVSINYQRSFLGKVVGVDILITPFAEDPALRIYMFNGIQTDLGPGRSISVGIVTNLDIVRDPEAYEGGFVAIEGSTVNALPISVTASAALGVSDDADLTGVNTYSIGASMGSMEVLPGTISVTDYKCMNCGGFLPGTLKGVAAVFLPPSRNSGLEELNTSEASGFTEASGIANASGITEASGITNASGITEASGITNASGIITSSSATASSVAQLEIVPARIPEE